MMTPFREATAGIASPYTDAWIKSGRQVVGYTCSFMPPEILHAAGILPYRLRGVGTETMEIGDAYYGPYVCTFPKCVLQLAGEGDYRFISGAVISTGCDAMRRLDECWRKAGDDYPGVLPAFFHYFDVPHKTDGHAMDWFENEIKKLISRVEDHFKVQIDDNKLGEAIAVYNHGRDLMREVEQFRTPENTKISGVDAFTLSVAATVMPGELFNDNLEKLLGDLRNRKPVETKGTKRLMLAGSVNDDSELVRLIESSGSTVVAENICFGIRSEADQVSTEDNPVSALAKRYLSTSVCPRMFGAYQQRFDYIKARAQRAGADGIILQNIRFCDLHGSENGLFERDFEKSGIPCLRLEREYGPLTETGRLKMRVEAFLERL
jgi:benzoyl-CoA reductase/2-hydroxyglutaryl-CoA dehydratase subunit BcrC/BadD/HgdB